MDKQKVLIVDDERDMVEVLLGRIERLGYESIVAYDGKEALEKIETENPDLILLDIAMPEPDGIGVLCWVRKQIKSMDTPVIVLSANSETETMSRAQELGSIDYLIKPVKLTEVEAIIKKWLPQA